MKYKNAKEQLEHALNNQKTIYIPKLKRLMMDLNMSLESSKDKEVMYLKGEIKKLRRELERANTRNRRIGKL